MQVQQNDFLQRENQLFQAFLLRVSAWLHQWLLYTVTAMLRLLSALQASATLNLNLEEEEAKVTTSSRQSHLPALWRIRTAGQCLSHGCCRKQLLQTGVADLQQLASMVQCRKQLLPLPLPKRGEPSQRW